MSSFVHGDNKKDILSLEKAAYFIKFTERDLHYNERNSYLFANKVNIYQFKVNFSKLNAYPVCLNVSRDSAVDNLKKSRLNEYVYNFSIYFETIDVDD